MTVLRNRLLARIVAPAGEPLTLTETKLYLRVDHPDEDSLIADLITAARMVAEHWMKRSLMTQTWKLAYDDYIDDDVYLPMGPVSDVVSVVAIERDGDSAIIDPELYSLNAAKNILRPETSLIAHRIEISYLAGYGGASSVPRPIKQGLLAHIAHMYDHRNGQYDSVIPDLSARLYMPYRELGL
ncbi:MAG: head-tail connector protein [Alphaproteobacteria bacterium]|nr:head-tail connector protein [Alphaproteobacteria bacterium]